MALVGARRNLPQLFGGSVEEYVKATGEDIPMVVLSCVRMINLYGMHHQGIFRVSGSQNDMNNYKTQFEQGLDPLSGAVVDGDDINTVAGLLKLYFRELRQPLFPLSMFDELIHCSQSIDSKDAGEEEGGWVTELRGLLARLPQACVVVLRYLFAFLNHVTEYSDENMMDSYNLSICFGPTLLPVPADRDLVCTQTYVNELVRHMISEHERLFPPMGLGMRYEKCIVAEEESGDKDGVDQAATSDDDLLTVSSIAEEEGALSDEAEGEGGWRGRSVRRALARYNFEGRSEQELSFRAGDTLTLLARLSPDWWRASLHGRTGRVPAKYIQLADKASMKGRGTSSSSTDLSSTLNRSTECLMSAPYSQAPPPHSSHPDLHSPLPTHAGPSLDSEGQPGLREGSSALPPLPTFRKRGSRGSAPPSPQEELMSRSCDATLLLADEQDNGVVLDTGSVAQSSIDGLLAKVLSDIEHMDQRLRASGGQGDSVGRGEGPGDTVKGEQGSAAVQGQRHAARGGEGALHACPLPVLVDSSTSFTSSLVREVTAAAAAHLTAARQGSAGGTELSTPGEVGSGGAPTPQSSQTFNLVSNLKSTPQSNIASTPQSNITSIPQSNVTSTPQSNLTSTPQSNLTFTPQSNVTFKPVSNLTSTPQPTAPVIASVVKLRASSSAVTSLTTPPRAVVTQPCTVVTSAATPTNLLVARSSPLTGSAAPSIGPSVAGSAGLSVAPSVAAAVVPSNVPTVTGSAAHSGAPLVAGCAVPTVVPSVAGSFTTTFKALSTSGMVSVSEAKDRLLSTFRTGEPGGSGGGLRGAEGGAEGKGASGPVTGVGGSRSGVVKSGSTAWGRTPGSYPAAGIKVAGSDVTSGGSTFDGATSSQPAADVIAAVTTASITPSDKQMMSAAAPTSSQPALVSSVNLATSSHPAAPSAVSLQSSCHSAAVSAESLQSSGHHAAVSAVSLQSSDHPAAVSAVSLQSSGHPAAIGAVSFHSLKATSSSVAAGGVHPTPPTPIQLSALSDAATSSSMTLGRLPTPGGVPTAAAGAPKGAAPLAPPGGDFAVMSPKPFSTFPRSFTGRQTWSPVLPPKPAAQVKPVLSRKPSGDGRPVAPERPLSSESAA